MAVPKLTPNDIIGRRLDLLGRAAQIDASAANVVTPIFTAGNTDFRAGGSRIFVCFIVIEVSDGRPLPAATTLGFGAAPGYNDWGVIAAGAAPWDALGVTPIILYPSIGLAQTFPPPVYGVGAAFGVKTLVIGATAQQLTVSCYGWAEN